MNRNIKNIYLFKIYVEYMYICSYIYIHTHIHICTPVYSKENVFLKDKLSVFIN